MSADAPPRGSLLLLGRLESMFFHSIFYVSFVHSFANTQDIWHQGARVMQGSFHLYEEHVGLELRDEHVPKSGRTNLSNVAQ